MEDELMNAVTSEVMDRLYGVIAARKGADPTESYTAKLFSRGTPKIAQKLGEEAVELVIEAVRADKKRIVAESTDLLYHLLVLWADAGVTPGEVWAELGRREGTSGHQRHDDKGA
ncbi:MAG: phosphoribosyl-ATP diphosphatase [Proteobacteria bacterium]|nr:phosphoribosyl-ATP diphosphatase [Pseudomonadota bacterium]